MKVKKIVLALLCLAMLVSATACSSSGVEKEVYDAVASERDELTQRVQQLESTLSEKEKEIESLKASSGGSDAVSVDYVESTTKNMFSDAVSFEINQKEKTVVVKFAFSMSMEDFVLVKDLIKEDHDSFIEDFSGLIKNMSDSFTGWTVVGIVRTTDEMPIEVVVNGTVVEY